MRRIRPGDLDAGPERMTTGPRADDGAGPLARRVAVVSGGGRGLGRSFCLALARQGAKVVVNNRNRVVDADGRGPADQVADQITAAGGEAVAEYSDAADPGSGQAMVAAALQRWGRLDICVANAAIGVGGMFHRQASEQFDEVLAINLQGSIRLARAAMAVMRPAGYGRIILVASTGGLHGDIGLSAYAASKGGLLAFGRSLAAEGAAKGVLTNLLLPYALTQMTEAQMTETQMTEAQMTEAQMTEAQMTDDGMPSEARKHLEPDAVAPVLTALASQDCRLNGEYIVTGGGRLRRASVVEWGTVPLPDDPDLSPEQLETLLAQSQAGEPKEFRVSVEAFNDLMDGGPR
jgi:NAD(P)-dependent dehydrogenase (short-subunit alcohol dehydrogenase family)